MRTPAVIASVLAGLLVGCGQPESSQWTELGYVPIRTLGADYGPGLIPGYATDLLERTNSEDVLLVAPGLPMRFGPAGDYLGELGANGEGPGEFREAYFGVALPCDSLLILDRTLGRATVISPGGEPRRVFRLLACVDRLSVANWPDSVLAVTRRCVPGQPGRFLRLLDFSTEPVSSLADFGDPWPTGPPANPPDRKILSTPVGGRVWSAEARGWSLRQWEIGGSVVHSADFTPDWLTPGNSKVIGEFRLYPEIVAIQELSPDTLVIVGLLLREDWREAWSRYRNPGHGPSESPHETELWETIVEFRDLRTGLNLGTQRISGIAFRLFPDGRVAVRDIRGPGFPFVRILGRPGLGESIL